MKFIITIHTTTDWHLTHRIKGHSNIQLNKKGRQEAKELARKLRKFNISRIICSDLQRSKQTAEIINSKLNVPLHPEKNLRECSFGKLEGMTRKEVIVKYGKSIIKDWEDQYKAYDFRSFGGEFRDDVLARHIKVLQRYSIFNPEDKAILLVGHGRGLSTLLAELGNPPTLKRGEYQIIEY